MFPLKNLACKGSIECHYSLISAPEIIDNKYYSERCDVWAIGVIMYML